MIFEENKYLAHYGILRRSGRYPWGSSDNQLTRSQTFLDMIEDLRKQGLKDTEICKAFNIPDGDGNFSTTQLRAAKAIAKNQIKQANIGYAQRLKDKGTSTSAIGRLMGINESSVRALLEPGAKDKADALTATADMLKRQVKDKWLVDVGSGVEGDLHISKDKLNTAVFMLREEGYEVHTVPVTQLGTGLDTRTKVLTPPGTTWGDVRRNQDKIQQIREHSGDGGRHFSKIHPAIAIDPKRVSVVFKEDGGAKADGVIYVREGVEDVSLGGNRYAQVRIQVGKEHYLKGMAIYKKDMPKGVDLVFNTNKEDKTGNKLDVMKEMKDNDESLPFGAVVSQVLADQHTDKERVTSAMNLVYEEGDWNDWSRNLSSQVLSKQTPTLAKAQLKTTQERRKNEYAEILALTNPAVRRKLLETFADSTDSAAVHLKAAALPRSNWQVILPVSSMKPTEVYAPGYDNGERVVLIRYPHGGTFEIPELTVNNRQPEARGLIGDGRDVIGIHSSVAERLSGADFDGDTVLVVPNGQGKIKTSPALEELKIFDTVASYPPYDGMPKLTSGRKQQLMGDVSNLITDMTLQAASNAELSRAVRHSMVIIDAEKHNLNYKQSAIDRGISQLKQEYQGKPRGGASTLISRKKSDDYRPELKARPQKDGGPVDRETGRKVFVETGRTRITEDGERIPKNRRYNKLALTDDAHTLSSGTPMEKIYADHSNKLKAMANEARLAAINTPPLKYSPSAKLAYANQVASLNSKLALAIMNRPLERQAQIIANAMVRAKRNANPDMDSETRKKIEYQELAIARTRTGAEKHDIKITDDEWNAIQAGAISNHKLTEILKKADLEIVRKHATPRAAQLMTTAKIQQAQSLLASGYTRAEVATKLGVSLTTLDTATVGSDKV